MERYAGRGHEYGYLPLVVAVIVLLGSGFETPLLAMRCENNGGSVVLVFP